MHTVLVVDDYAGARDLLEAALTKAGYLALTASDGSEALTIAHATIPDAIVMDICMPVMDGMRATELLKSDPTTAGIPVIAYTAEPQPMDGRTHLFAAICMKPGALTELFGLLRQMLQSPPHDLMPLHTVPIGHPIH